MTDTTTKSANFVQQVRERAEVITTKLGGPFDLIDPVTATILRQAATHIEELEHTNAKMREALDPFARVYVVACEPFNLPDHLGARHYLPGYWPTIGDLRRARQALGAKP